MRRGPSRTGVFRSPLRRNLPIAAGPLPGMTGPVVRHGYGNGTRGERRLVAALFAGAAAMTAITHRASRSYPGPPPFT